MTAPSSQILLLILFVLLSLSSTLTVKEEDVAAEFFGKCPVKRCNDHEGPEIRFPFRLKQHYPESCCLAGFELSCKNNRAVLQLPFSGEQTVTKIDYLKKLITIKVSDPNCPVQSLLHLNPSASPFNFSTPLNYEGHGFLLVNCSSKNGTSMLQSRDEGIVGPISCLSDQDSSVYIVDSYEKIDSVTCAVSGRGPISIDGVSGYGKRSSPFKRFRNMVLEHQEIVLKWEAQEIGEGCSGCERNRSYCGFNSTAKRILCYHPPHHGFRKIINFGSDRFSGDGSLLR